MQKGQQGPVSQDSSRIIELIGNFVMLGPRISQVLRNHGAPELLRELETVQSAMQNIIDRNLQNKEATDEEPLPDVNRQKPAESRRLNIEDLTGACNIWAPIKHSRGLGNAYAEIGWAYLDNREYREARSHARNAIMHGRKCKSETVQTRGWILLAAVARAMEEDMNLPGRNYPLKVRAWSQCALRHAALADPETCFWAFVWAALVQLTGEPGADEHRKAEHYYEKAKGLLRGVHRATSQRDFDELHRRLFPENEGAKTARKKLLAWMNNPKGISASEVESWTTLIAWSAIGTTGTSEDLCRSFTTKNERMSRNAAGRRLADAGIIPVRKMPKRANGAGGFEREKGLRQHAI